METWNITITSPMGETTALLRLDQDRASLNGEMTGKGGSGPVEAGRVEGDQYRWNCRIEKPMPMTLKFKGTRTGNELSGTVKFGVFASGGFTAVPA